MIILNSLLPIFFLIILGGFLKKIQFATPSFFETSDKLVYYIFFPILLFWKIGSSSFDEGLDTRLYMAVLIVLLLMFIMSSLAIKVFQISDYQAGTFSQSSYRFNTYIGMAVILNSLGAEGIKYFGILISFSIPLINIFAVTLLIWFSGKEIATSKRYWLIIKSLLSNPLIIGCVLGLLYSHTFESFPTYINNSLQLISMVTLPLALLSIGGSLTLQGCKKHFRLSLLAALLKLFILPGMGYVALLLFGVDPLPLKVGMIFFALPTSTAIYVLSSQMNSDTELASSAILLSTILSFFTLSIALLL